MNDDVKAFFSIYDADPALRDRVLQAEALYPGSLEIRQSVVDAVLLPVAKEMGFDFTVEDLRKYEEALWESRHRDVDPAEESIADEDSQKYWLLGRGWSNDEARFCGDGK